MSGTEQRRKNLIQPAEHYKKNGINYKKCSGCGEFKECSKEYRHASKKGLFGLDNKCKPCASIRAKTKNKTNNGLKEKSSAPWKEVEGVMFKQCTVCLEFKEATADNFFRKKNGLFGLASICKSCRHKNYMDNIEINKEKAKKYREEHKEEKKQRDAEYRRTHKEHLSKYFKRHREENIERIKAVQREYYKNNKDKVKDRALKWYEENREYATEKRKERAKEKGYNKIHGAVFRFLHSNNIVFEECSICGGPDYIECHHPNNDIWNEVVVCCRSCHHRIHGGSLECPHPIDLLEYIKQNDE